ncbi:MAG: RHS repeat-associated core domain-containing protein [Micropepsaceae bacterium]
MSPYCLLIAMSADDGTLSEGPYTYDAYGNGAPATGVPFKYTGRRLDAGTGLYYYRARYYWAVGGRFLQVDPVGYKDHTNLYAYVLHDPMNATDPSGKDCESTKGTTTCTTADYTVRFKTPAGFKDFKSTDKGYHRTNEKVKARGNDKKTTEKFVKDHPTPGNPKPATPEGTRNDATPCPLCGVVPENPVVSYSTTNEKTGNPVVVNVTLPAHNLAPGIVVREVNETPDGSEINNYGEGTGWPQAQDNLVGQVLGPIVNCVAWCKSKPQDPNPPPIDGLGL